MRIKVHLHGSGVLPFNYHYHLSSALYTYKKIANKELATRLHYSREIKTFTFSEIMIPKRKITKEGIKFLDDYAYFIYSSPSKDYVKAVVEGMLSNPEFRVGKFRFMIEKIEVLPAPNVDWHDVTFKTLSPISLYSSSDGRKKEPLYPTDTLWYVNIEKNIKHEYLVFYGEEPRGRIEIKTLHFKPKKYKFRKVERGKVVEGAIKAVHGHFRFRGNPELIKFAYEAGAGEHGAWGFGCLDVVNEHRKE